jgi:hypothetical protein
LYGAQCSGQAEIIWNTLCEQQVKATSEQRLGLSATTP